MSCSVEFRRLRNPISPRKCRRFRRGAEVGPQRLAWWQRVSTKVAPVAPRFGPPRDRVGSAAHGAPLGARATRRRSGWRLVRRSGRPCSSRRDPAGVRAVSRGLWRGPLGRATAPGLRRGAGRRRACRAVSATASSTSRGLPLGREAEAEQRDGGVDCALGRAHATSCVAVARPPSDAPRRVEGATRSAGSRERGVGDLRRAVADALEL